MLYNLTRRFRNSVRSRSAQRRQTNRRRLIGNAHCEQLEDRRLLTADVLLADSFEDGQWNNKWVEDSQNDWFDSSQRAVDGSRSAEIDGRATDAGLTLADPIDLSGYDNAELTFSWFIEKNWDSGEYIALDVQTGGNWQEVRTLQGNVDQENVWHQETVDLSGFLSNDFKIRFRANVSGGREDGNVDNVLIEGTNAGSTFVINDVQMNEGDSGTTDFIFTVTRGGDTSGTATIDFATADGTATTGDGDYTATGGTLTFGDGVTSQQLNVAINGDTALESAEVFTVALSNPSAGDSITDGSGQATVLNDDGAGADEFELSSLLGANGGDGSQGVVIPGLETARSTLNSLSIIDDVNGDGRDDILIAGTSLNAAERGKVFVVFGQDGGIGSDFDLTTLNGSNGYQINGPWDANNLPENEWFGAAVGGAGDVNGDGLGDIIIGAPRALDATGTGAAYVILGSTTPTATLEVDALDGTNGFKIIGPDTVNGAPEIGDLVGSAGDINGDGFSDILVESFNWSGGSAIVLFGASSFGTPSASAVIDLNDIDGTNGFIIDNVGISAVQTPLAGDFNGDGIDDLAIGAYEGAGRVSVLMGRAATTSNPNPFINGVDLLMLDGSDGFNVGGLAEGDRLGYSARSAGDMNADGIDDIVMGALYAEPGGKYRAGESYVIFGQQADFPADFDLATLDGTNGFYVSGGNDEDRSSSVSGIGDFNADGIDDIAILAGKADPANGSVDAGQLYIVYGRDNGFSAGIDLATLEESQGTIFNGFRENGLMTRLGPGSGDVNGDGRPDLTLIARKADPNGIQDAGEVYVVYGREAGDPSVDPEASLSIGNSSVTEAASGMVGMEFVVTLSEAVTEDVTVDYATTDLTATAGADYVAISGTLTIPEGETTATLIVQVNADSPLEGDERFVLTLSNPDGATIQYATATATIIDYIAPTKFYVVDGSGQEVNKYSADGSDLGGYNYDLYNPGARGVAADATGSRIWYVFKTGWVAVDDSSGNRVALWGAEGLSKPEGIATEGENLWIVDKGNDQVHFFAAAADIIGYGSSVNATSSFALNSGNRNPRGITTDGTHLWVVNSKSAKDEVFKYTTSGTLVGKWTIDTANVNPRGITIDPNDVNHLWIVDSTTDSVYQYSGAASRTSGSQSADSVFGLSAENSNPQGIADPPPPSAVGIVENSLHPASTLMSVDRSSHEFAFVDRAISGRSAAMLFGHNEADARVGDNKGQMHDQSQGETLLLDNVLKTDWKSVLDVDGESKLSDLDTAFADWASGNLADRMDILGGVLDDDDKDDQFREKDTDTVISGASDEVKE